MTSTSSDKITAIGRTAFFAFCVIAALFLIYEHTMHVLGALPYLLLLACPLMHVFMHHGHHHGGESHDAAGSDAGTGVPSAMQPGHGGLQRGDKDWTEKNHA